MSSKKAEERTKIDLIILVLVAILMATSAVSMKQADWTDALGILSSIALLGVLSGALLSNSRFPSWVAFLFSTCYGLFVVGAQLIRSTDPFMLLHERILSIFSRIGFSIQVLIQSKPNDDPLMFVALMGLYFWICGSYAAWNIFRRKRYWLTILPAGIGLLINAYFYFGPIHVDFYVAFYVFVSLLLAMWFDQTRRQALWESIRAQVPPNVALRIARSGLLAASALVLIAWATPALARARNLSELLEAADSPLASARDWFEDFFSSLRSPSMVISDYYGEELPLEAGVEPLNVLVMHVDTSGTPSNSGRFYWRAQTYNFYDAGKWTVTRYHRHSGLCRARGFRYNHPFLGRGDAAVVSALTADMGQPDRQGARRRRGRRSCGCDGSCCGGLRDGRRRILGHDIGIDAYGDTAH